MIAAFASWSLAPSASAGVIVFSSDRCPERPPEGCSRTLWTINDDGSDMRRLTTASYERPSGEGSFDDQPTWTPDGTAVLYRRQLFARAGQHSLWVVPLEGSPQYQIGPDAPNDRFTAYDLPDWSPDGRWITFAATPADTTTQAVWLMSADGSEIRRLTDGSTPQFSPDGRRIAFVRRLSENESGIFTANLEGSDVRPVFVGTPPGAEWSINAADSLRVSWSPLGTHFALVYRDDVYTVRSSGDGLTWRGRLGRPFGPFAPIVWMLDPFPALLFAHAPETGPQPLYRFDLTQTGATPTQLTATPEPSEDGRYSSGDSDPAWRPSLPLPPVVDDIPPVVLPIDVGLEGSDVEVPSGVMRVSRGRLGFAGLDPAGVRKASMSLRRRGRGGCRFLGREGLFRARSCSRPRWNPVRGADNFRRLMRPVRPGRYVLRLRAVDARGNRQTRGQRFVVRIRARG